MVATGLSAGALLGAALARPGERFNVGGVVLGAPPGLIIAAD